MRNVTEEPAASISSENLAWIVIDAVIIVLTLAGNILTICAIILSRKISELLSNRYIFSLAVSDLLVGLTIPYHLTFTIGHTLDTHKITCILRFVFTILACASSMYNLLAIAADRYIAIVLPFHYSRHMNKKIVWTIVIIGWLLSLIIAATPIYWNNWTDNDECTLKAVLPSIYINFIVTPMFLSIWLVMSLLYFRIWREAAEHARRLRTATFQHNQKQKKTLKENKSVQMVMLILGCFSICWLPYFITITCMIYLDDFDSKLIYECSFTMAVMNSCMNPLIYAWKFKNYRRAFCCMLQCKSPRTLADEPNFITDHVPKEKRKADEEEGTEYGISTMDIEMRLGGRVKYDERENSDVTVQTCIGN